MEINIKNFGPIKEVNVDLSKDLTILYGKNNIGKSYAISVIYLLLKQFLNIETIHFGELIPSESRKKYKDIDKLIHDKKECDITNKINDVLKDIYNNRKAFSGILENSLTNTFHNLSNLINYKSNEIPVIQINLTHLMIRFAIKKTVVIEELSLKKRVLGKYSRKIRLYSPKENEYILFACDDLPPPGFINTFQLFLMSITDEIRDEIRKTIKNIYFLPAFRSGIYSVSKSFFLMLAELSKKRAFITEKIELPRIPEPTADYILHLSEISRSRTGNKKLGEIVRYLEKNILKGKVDFDDEKHLTYQPANSKLVLEMSSVSSMLSELSTITAFIKFILPKDMENKGGKTPKPVIFIEEPEAHLHPEAQVRLVEFFLMLLKVGVKLIITSHSNYIFNKLNNMIMNRTFDYNIFAPILLQDTKNGSVGKLLKTDDLGVDDENFLETADSLYEERENILDRLNNEADDQ